VNYLQEYAQTALRCRDFAAELGRVDPRWPLLLQRLSAATGVSRDECERRIEQMASGTYVEESSHASSGWARSPEAMFREIFGRRG
jgi:hypothetical protein